MIRALLLAAVLSLALAAPAFAQNPWLGEPVLNMAHQGGEDELPSNTMYAFRKALAVGADMLELDVHATRDGQLIVMHDWEVDRTTNGSGYVTDLTLAQVRRLDAAYNFVPGRNTVSGLPARRYPLRGVRSRRRDALLDHVRGRDHRRRRHAPSSGGCGNARWRPPSTPSAPGAGHRGDGVRGQDRWPSGLERRGLGPQAYAGAVTDPLARQAGRSRGLLAGRGDGGRRRVTVVADRGSAGGCWTRAAAFRRRSRSVPAGRSRPSRWSRESASERTG